MSQQSIAIDDIETVIGLEVHLQFNTVSKIFCGCANVFGQEPNTSTCPVCLGLPGSLPVLNEQALRSAVKVALALDCEVNHFIKFDRKNYYYPDLPKGYQISQFDHPIGRNGHIMVSGETGPRRLGINRAHLEEDAGKLIHDPVTQSSLVDYNRTGTPLMEIVSEPDIRSPQEAYEYLQTLKLILQYLGVSDCDMEKGSLRCDANISVRPRGQAELGTKSEIKNLNSFKAVKASLEFEEGRHRALLQAGQTIVQETRLWDEAKAVTVSMRSKEQAHDYRYFPEPDLVPFQLTAEEIDAIRATLPESPAQKRDRFVRVYQLSDYDVNILVQDRSLADFFEQCVAQLPSPKKVCNWLIGPVQQELNARRAGIGDLPLCPATLTALIAKVEAGEISNLAGKEILRERLDTGRDIQTIIDEKGLAQVSDDAALAGFLDAVFAENANAVEELRAGKQQALGFLIGRTMQKTGGKANPKVVGDLIKRRLGHE